MSANENRTHCERIAHTLSRYYEGDVYICPECGEHCSVTPEYDANGNEQYKMSCGCTSEYEPEQASLFDFFSDVFDVEYRIDSSKEYRSVKVMIAFGGPNIYIDTADRTVKLYWWTDYAEYPLSHNVCDEIDYIFSELFQCQ